MHFDLSDFTKKITCENMLNDAVAETIFNNKSLDLYLTAKADKVKIHRT